MSLSSVKYNTDLHKNDVSILFSIETKSQRGVYENYNAIVQSLYIFKLYISINNYMLRFT